MMIKNTGRFSADEADDNKWPDRHKPPARGERFDDQSEEADDTGLYDRDEDAYSQDAGVLEEEDQN
jgi:hypothetical protein